MAQCQGPYAQMVKLFLPSPTFGQKILRKSPKVLETPRNVNPARLITWLVSVTIYCNTLQ